MSTHHGRSYPALILFGAALWIGSAPGGRGEEWQALLENSPFGPPMAQPATAATGIEFRGVVQEGNIWLVNLAQSATKASYWIPVGSEAAGLRVRSYDEATGRVVLVQDGRLLVLPLKQFRLALVGDNVPLKLLSPPEQVSAREAPAMPDFLRDLPPEARQLLEEARRRRAIRWPAPSAGAGDPPTTP